MIFLNHHILYLSYTRNDRTIDNREMDSYVIYQGSYDVNDER